MGDYMQITVDLITGFAVLFIFNKVLGKAHFSQLTPFEFIAALVMGDLVGNAVYTKDTNGLHIVYAFLIWGTMVYLIGLFTMRSLRMRKFFEGEPSIVIRQGIIQYEIMRRNTLDMEQLLSQLRMQGYFSLREIEYAILEPNGSISVMPKTEYDVPRNGAGSTLPPNRLAITLITDGRLLSINLAHAGIGEPWLREQLLKQNYASYASVLYAEWHPANGLFVLPYASEPSARPAPAP